jgi:hypothetical protein
MVGGLADYLLDLVARPGDGFAGKFLLAAGEVAVGRSAGRAAFADHVGDGSGVKPRWRKSSVAAWIIRERLSVRRGMDRILPLTHV